MSATFGGTIKLEGESEYRKALSTINQQIKTTASELSLLAVQYDKNETSIENYTEQNRILEKEIKQQEEKIGLLRSAMEQAAKTYGENDSKTQKYAQSLNKAQAELIKMQREVDDNKKAIAELGNKTDNTTQDIKQFSKATETAGSNTMKMGEMIKANLTSGAIVGGVSVLVSLVGNLAQGTVDLITSAAAYADEVLTLSNNTGVAVQMLENYNTVAQLIDVDTEVMTNSMAKNIKSMDAAKDTYDKLGVSIKNTDGSMRNSTEVYWECIDALGKIENETERDAMAMDLFGKSAQDLNSLIKVGSGGFEEFSQKASKLNAILSEDGVAALGSVDDSIQWLKASLENTGKIGASAFAPIITSTVDAATQSTGKLNGLLQTIISGGDTTVAEEELSASIQETLSSAVEGVTSMADVILQPLLSSFFGVLAESGPDVLDFALDTLMTLITTILAEAPTLIQSVLDIVVSLVTTLAQPEGLPSILTLVAGLIPSLVVLLFENVPVILSAAISLFMSIVDSIPVIIDELVSALPSIVETSMVVLLALAPQLLAAAIQLLMSLVTAIPVVTLSLVENTPLLIKSIISGLLGGLNEMKNVGIELISGLWEGFKSKIEWLKERVSEFGKNFIENIRNIFDINSPSGVMRDEVGVYLAEGVGVGFIEGMDKVNEDIKNALPTDYSVGINAAVNGDIQTSYMVTTLEMFKEALSAYSPVVILDEKVVGKFVLTTVSREVFA